jgi:hypothetical protein
VAALVYYRLGLRLLRPLWVNVDRVWAGALIVTGVLTPLLYKEEPADSSAYGTSWEGTARCLIS